MAQQQALGNTLRTRQAWKQMLLHILWYWVSSLSSFSFTFRPFGVAFSHEERWKYLNRNRKSQNDPEYLACAINKNIRHLYCIRKEYVYGRFSYFSSNFITYVNVNLTISQKQLLKEQLSIETEATVVFNVWHNSNNRLSFLWSGTRLCTFLSMQPFTIRLDISFTLVTLENLW